MLVALEEDHFSGLAATAAAVLKGAGDDDEDGDDKKLELSSLYTYVNMGKEGDDGDAGAGAEVVAESGAAAAAAAAGGLEEEEEEEVEAQAITAAETEEESAAAAEAKTMTSIAADSMEAANALLIARMGTPWQPKDQHNPPAAAAAAAAAASGVGNQKSDANDGGEMQSSSLKSPPRRTRTVPNWLPSRQLSGEKISAAGVAATAAAKKLYLRRVRTFQSEYQSARRRWQDSSSTASEEGGNKSASSDGASSFRGVGAERAREVAAAVATTALIPMVLLSRPLRAAVKSLWFRGGSSKRPIPQKLVAKKSPTEVFDDGMLDLLEGPVDNPS